MENNNTSLALQGLSRPSLAVINEDYPKVKNIDVAEIETLVNFMITILNIKISSKEEEENLDIQMAMVIDLIRTKFGYLTVPEIKEAFKMYVSREFTEIKVFRMLDCVAIGDILHAFTNFRTESLRSYTEKKTALLNAPKKASDEEKKIIRENFLRTLFEELKTSQYSADAWILFDEMEASGLLSISNYDKELQYKIEEKRYLEELQSALAKNPNSTVLKSDIKSANESIKNKKRLSIVKNRCRSRAVSDYLSRFTDDFENFKSILS